jgi:hypothetical protein
MPEAKEHPRTEGEDDREEEEEEVDETVRLLIANSAALSAETFTLI